MWSELVEGPAVRLAENLDASDWSTAHTEKVLKAYLEFAAEAVGLGYIYPSEEVGRHNFFNLAWFDLLPEELPTMSPERQLEVVAGCWNLGENLETRPSWLQHLFMDEVESLDSLTDFESKVEEITSKILGTPRRELERDPASIESAQLHWVHLGESHPRFLPGAVEFLAPGVAAVHHRHTDLDGEPKSSIGLSLVDEPEALGTMRLTEASTETTAADSEWWEALAERDSRLTTPYSCAANRWRAVYTLETSQYIVAVRPAPDGEAGDD